MAKKMKLIINGKRLDGRNPLELRNISIKLGVIKNADGSAYIEWGKNKIIASAFGPKEALPKHLADPHRAVLRCVYMMAPFCSLEEHGKIGFTRRSVEISKLLKEALSDIVLLDRFPNTIIDVYVNVLQADGSTRVASLTAASLALLNAGLPLKGLIAAVSGGKADDTLIIDLGKEEDNYGQADMPIAYNSNGDIILFQADGLLTKEEIEKLLDYTNEAAKKIFEIERNAIYETYGKEMKKTLRI